MSSWPDYCTRETLAKRLNLAVGAIDQLVARGILPEPTKIGDAYRYRWIDVDTRLQQAGSQHNYRADPYMEGVKSSEAPPARTTRSQ